MALIALIPIAAFLSFLWVTNPNGETNWVTGLVGFIWITIPMVAGYCWRQSKHR